VTITNIIKDLIYDTWNDFQKKGESPSPKELHARAFEKYKEPKNKDKLGHLKFPSLSWVEHVGIEVLRKSEASLDPKVKKEDAQWSLGVSDEYSFASEANEILLYISMLCKIVRRQFIIREAKWTARLVWHSEQTRDRLPLKHWWHLYRFGVEYARRERVWHMKSVADGTTLDTSDLDAQLLFPLKNWAYWGGVRTGIISEGIDHCDGSQEPMPELASPLLRHGIIAMEFISQVHMEAFCEHLLISLEWWAQLGHGLKNEEATLVYAIWLMRFAETSQWQSFDVARKVAVANRLHGEVRAAYEEILTKTEYPDFKIAGPPTRGDWKPSLEILKEVGLDNNSLVEPSWSNERYDRLRESLREKQKTSSKKYRKAEV